MKKLTGILASTFLIGIMFNTENIQANTKTSKEDLNSEEVVDYVPGYDPNEIATSSNSDSQLSQWTDTEGVMSSSTSKSSSARSTEKPHNNSTKPSQVNKLENRTTQSVKNGWINGVYYKNNLSVNGYVQVAPGGANGGYLWLENGHRFTGFRHYMGTYYWFNNGVRQNSGWRNAWGLKYYTDKNGRAVQGNYIVDGQAYNFGSNGTFFLRSGISGYVDAGQGWRWYDNGSMFTGFRFYMGTYYWFTNGVRQDNGWHTAWGLKYYTDNTGRAVQGWQNIDGKSYYFGDNGTFFLR